MSSMKRGPYLQPSLNINAKNRDARMDEYLIDRWMMNSSSTQSIPEPKVIPSSRHFTAICRKLVIINTQIYNDKYEWLPLESCSI